MFSKKELNALLPDNLSTSDPNFLRQIQSISTRTTLATPGKDDTTFQPPKPRVDPSKKISRHRAGVNKDATYDDDDGFATKSALASTRTPSVDRNKRTRIQPKILTSTETSKVEQLRKQRLKDRRRRHSSDSSSEESEKDERTTGSRHNVGSDNESDDHRQRIRARVLKKKAIAEQEQLPVAERIRMEESSESEGESEWETDSDDSDAQSTKMFKPVFVPKAARDTVKQQEKEQKLAEDREKRRLEQATARRRETRHLVATEIRREREQVERTTDTTDEEMPDDTDGLNPDEEYKSWEIREMRRIIRDREERTALQKELEEIQRRRNMTDEERRREDEKKGEMKKEKEKWSYLQKYYHKGAFYIDDDSIKKDKKDVRLRDASGQTLEDKFNKELMPKVMQVKNFGRSGQTKYTHLADQDTSERSSTWGRNDRIREKYQEKMAGMGSIDQAGRKRKR